MLAATLLYFALARFGMAIFALQPSNITLLWLPSGIALVMCLQWGRRALPLIALASFCANVGGMSGHGAAATVLHTAISALADALTGALAMAMLRRRVPQQLRRATDLAPFALYVCLVPAATTGAILAANLAAGGYIGWRDTAPLFAHLVMADSLGLLLVYPLYQSWATPGGLAATPAKPLLLATLALAALMLASLAGAPGMEYFFVPVLLVLSFYAGMFSLTALGGLALVAVFAMAAHQAGPFAGIETSQGAFRVGAFAVASALTILGVALQRGQLEDTEITRQLWQEAAEHDPLTGLANRRIFLPQVHLEHERSLRNALPYAVAMLDLDHFKLVNDRYGHGGGDIVLKAVADLLQENCRQIDLVARVGGEEFAILLPGCSGAQAAPLLERLRGKLAALRVRIGEQQVTVTTSIGVASFADHAESTEHLVARADQALYRAKKAGRNRVVVDTAEGIAPTA